ncbi:hypothetical protein KC19_10G063600 [Ceratodon purpureus]|uniref:Arf-GAP domain-containing protein n=1 Tax=Ceratodon purpureus TaxID=3225 RepID=A0A8T0GKZ6_CERPU|nr:hypothetical protein KC19_10G063600 [Ceratodon purpureus]
MEQELRLLLKRPGNDACADCGGRYPRFASISLAVFLCNRCYGIHRSIGTHITRTKTVGLDRWSADEVHRMSAIGNVAANSYWEENGPPIFQRPTADSPDFEVEKWIRDKYERKLFCSKEKEPPSVTPQMSEIVNPDASIRSVSPQVKLLPRGTLRCGPDCTVPSPPSETSSAVGSTPRDDFFLQLRSPRSSQHRTSGSAATLLKSPVNPQPGTSHAYGKAVEVTKEKQSEPTYDDDEDFGDFVQA